MDLAYKIRTKRLQLKMTQEQMAGRLGVTAPAVHKWEYGTAYPDITLLPALARLLEIDLNELFSFDQDITDQELASITTVAMEIMKAGHYADAFAFLKRKARQYPKESKLLVQCAATADSGMKLYAIAPGEEKTRYEEQIIRWYQEAAANGTGQIREMALYMLSILYTARERFDEAQNALEQLSEAPYDKQVLKANLARQKGNLDEALQIMQTRLFKNVSGVIASLALLMGYYKEKEDSDMQRLINHHIRMLTEQFQFWDYNIAVMDLEEAVLEKSKEKTLAAVRKLINCVEAVYDPRRYPLFALIDAREVKMGGYMLPTIRTMLAGENGIDGEGFLKDDPDLQELIDLISLKMEEGT